MAARARHQGAASSTVFVTVGTTSFDDLIVAVTSDTALTNLAAIGVDTLVVQYGRGTWPAAAAPANRKSHGVMVRHDVRSDGLVVDVCGCVFGCARGTLTECFPPSLTCILVWPQVKAYALKPSTADDIAAARFVVCHGGAGSIFDTLRAGRPAVVVPNATLMGNHQLELAHALEEANHVCVACCRAAAS